MQFAVFDNDAVVSAMQHVWDRIAPKAMFTAAGNHAKRTAEDFSKVLDHIRWNITTSLAAMSNFSIEGAENSSENTQSLSGSIITNIDSNSNGTGAVSYNYDYGFSGTSTIKPETQKGSNGGPKTYDSEFNYFVESWNDGDNIYVPAGFSPIRGENIVYADTLPPFDITLTWANEYGQTAFKKIYDVDILNVSSGASVDSIVMEETMTYIARRISPLVRGVYSRESNGEMKGISPTSAS